MKLLYSPTSPYARKARAVLGVKSLVNIIDEKVLNRFDEKPMLSKHNPLGKVPALILENSTVLYDSDVICDYFDTLGNSQSLWPLKSEASKMDYWKVRTMVELANGIMDAALALVMEKNRPSNEQSDYWKENYKTSIERSTNTAGRYATELEGRLGMDNIALGCAIGYDKTR